MSLTSGQETYLMLQPANFETTPSFGYLKMPAALSSPAIAPSGSGREGQDMQYPNPFYLGAIKTGRISFALSHNGTPGGVDHSFIEEGTQI